MRYARAPVLKRLGWVFFAALIAGCPDRSQSGNDAGKDAGVVDSGTPPEDAGEDAGIDAGTPEDGGVDAGELDAGELDAGSPDAGEDAGVDAGEVDAGPPLMRCRPRDGGFPDGGVLRVIAANLSSGNLQSWDPGHGARILQGLHPDLVLIQEWNVGDKSDSARRAWVDSTFGPEFCYQVEDFAQIPNGVISRYPIVDAGNWTDSQVNNRSFVWAQIDVPGDRDLWAVSLHLLTTTSAHAAEGAQLLANFNLYVPDSGFLVIGGDLNTGSRTDSAVTAVASRLKISGPHPADGSGNQNTNTNRNSPYDWVIADPLLASQQVPVLIGDAGVFDAGLVFDTRVFTPLSDVAPAQAGDSAAPNMQHMAVVKDFLLP